MVNLFNEEPVVGVGMYSIPHIVFLAIAIPLVIAGIILVMKYVKSEKALRLTVMITAATLFVVLIAGRIGYAYQRVVIEHGSRTIEVGGKELVLFYNWGYILPETFCGLTSFFLPIAVLCFKKDNIFLHALIYFGLIGGVAASFYPTYLDTQGFFELGTMTSLIYHFILLFLCLIILLKKYMVPSIKKWYAVPMIYIFFVLFALFEVHALKTPSYEAMSIYYPLVSSLPHLTKFYCLGPALMIGIIIVLFFYEHFKNKKDIKTIFREMVFIKDKPVDQVKEKN